MPENIQHKSTKDVVGTGVLATDEEQGIVEALVSVTGIVDNVNDIIVPGAYAKTLSERRPKGVWSHDWNTPVSKALDIAELMPGDDRLPKTLPNGDAWPAEAGALWVKAQFNLATAAGKDAFANVKFFEDDGEWSIGYSVPKGSATEEKVDTPTGKKSVRKIKSLNLYEFSPVLFGAASNARTFAHSIKSMFATDEARDEFIKALEDEDTEAELAAEANAEGDVVANSEEKHDHNDEEEFVGPEVSDESKEVREVSVKVNLTGPIVEQLKTLQTEINRLLESVVAVEEAKADEVELEEKSLNDAIEDVVASSVDVKVAEEIDTYVVAFQKSLDENAEDINDRAMAALDRIGEALTDVDNENDEKSLKILANSIGVALRTSEEKTVEEVVVEPVTEEKKITIDANEWASFKNLRI